MPWKRAIHLGWELHEKGILGNSNSDREKAKDGIRKVILSEIDAGRPVLAIDKWAAELQNEAIFVNMVKKDSKTAEGESLYRQYWYSNGWVYNSRYDARVSAHKFLNRISSSFDDVQKKYLESAAALFTEVAGLLWQNWVHFPMPFWVREQENRIWIPGDRFADGTEWTQEMRAKGAQALREISAKEEEEKEVHKLLAKATTFKRAS